jgi:ribonuclease HI
MEKYLVVHSDGGSRGNPGPGACAFVAEENGRAVAEDSKFLGKVTNNVAEYEGVLLAIRWMIKELKNFNAKHSIVFCLDSELVAKQLSGLYKIKNPTLVKLNIEIKDLISKHRFNIAFRNIPREENKQADFLVNRELDKRTSGNFL